MANKATAWKWFSLYIRLKYAMDGGYVKCVTCSTIHKFNEGIQAGHYFSQGAFRRIVFDERNCHPQCISCNYYNSANLTSYTTFMVDTYGADIFDRLRIENKIRQPIRDFNYLSDKYRNLAKERAKEIGVEI